MSWDKDRSGEPLHTPIGNSARGQELRPEAWQVSAANTANRANSPRGEEERRNVGILRF